MKMIYLMFATLLFALSGLSSYAQPAQSGQDETVANTGKIEVYYFHNTRRCATCKAIEDVTRKTLEENYQQQMKSGEITFQSLNIEEDSNETLATKLHVSGQTLLFVKDGKKEDLTNDAFMYARSSPEKLKTKIISAIEKL